MTDVRGAAGGMEKSDGSVSEEATPLETRMWDDVLSVVEPLPDSLGVRDKPSKAIPSS